MRLDKWLWCARFYKTRALAVQDIEKHRIHVNQGLAKPSREVRPGDVIAWINGPVRRTVVVRALAGTRGPATVAQQLYEETPESLAARARQAELRRLTPEPANTLRDGRPTKKDRRELAQLQSDWQGTAENRAFDARWSATLDGTGQH
ncbi:RNA-binding protein S4 [Lampropedia cohaerens]|uniref:RNA-binding protein S4 n=1 Tax=Lampropedia cohaerens TaxID=1610491 RepID=A0A0U1PXB6_9BURK|nr:S4 domain-containing protein [Lampropedia cohaerens]KKW67178.1 RNA-binding protein S4 [Lampropedia cohaerens]